MNAACALRLLPGRCSACRLSGVYLSGSVTEGPLTGNTARESEASLRPGVYVTAEGYRLEQGRRRQSWGIPRALILIVTPFGATTVQGEVVYAVDRRELITYDDGNDLGCNARYAVTSVNRTRSRLPRPLLDVSRLR